MILPLLMQETSLLLCYLSLQCKYLNSRWKFNKEINTNGHNAFTNLYICLFRPTFRRIIRRQSTEQFSGLPYVYALLNCLICLWYGMPIISPGIILVATVNSVGAIFQMIYIIIFIAYAERGKKVRLVRLIFPILIAYKVFYFE